MANPVLPKDKMKAAIEAQAKELAKEPTTKGALEFQKYFESWENNIKAAKPKSDRKNDTS